MHQFGPDTPGNEVYAVVLSSMKAGPAKRFDFEACPGFVRWRSFLEKRPDATLAQCLVEFERSMKTKPTDGWVRILMLTIGNRVYPEFKKRVLAMASSVEADYLVRHAKSHALTDSEQTALANMHGLAKRPMEAR